MNDGSTDGSSDILSAYEKKDERVQVVHKENSGLSSARNAGLKYATGEFIAFIDSDDWIHEEYFSTLLQIQQKKDYDVVLCDYVHTKDSDILDFSAKEFEEFELTREQYISNRKSKSHVWGRLYKRSTIQGLEFDEAMQIEDAMYNLVYIHQNLTLKAIYITAPLYGYYQRAGSLVTKIGSDGMFALAEKYFQYAELEREAATKNNMYIESIKKCLAAGYGYKVTKNKTQLKESGKLANRGLKKLKGNKRKYVIMVKLPFVYRLFRILNDPTLLEWEKQVKRKS